jgi:hypothetical protein
MLHSLYGKDTKIVANEFGGFEFKQNTDELDFARHAQKNSSSSHIDVIDFLNKNELVSVSFVGVSSDLFKNDL